MKKIHYNKVKLLKYSLFFAFLLSLCILLYFSKSILTPFIMGAVLSYILTPFAKIINKYFLTGKCVASFLAVAIFYSIALAFIVYVFPTVYKQVMHLYNFLITADISSVGQILKEKILKYLPGNLQEATDALLTQIPQYSVNFFTKLIAGIGQSTEFALHLIVVNILTPFITFYVLRDIDKISENFMMIIPKHYHHSLTFWISEIDNVFIRFLHAQVLVASIWAVYYSVGFSVINLSPAIPLGILSGVMIFIPYLGVIIGFCTCCVVAVLQFGLSTKIYAITALFMFGSVLDTAIVSPKIVGKKLGLHPLLTIFSLLLSANIFGILGMFLALPITVIIIMFLHVLLDKYNYE
ncbi:conserved membrane hypothetical protein [Alphaproteobacteria bacterium]